MFNVVETFLLPWAAAVVGEEGWGTDVEEGWGTGKVVLVENHFTCSSDCSKIFKNDTWE